ncbi:MAG: hypothetical protein HYS23_14245 [Geobacter sp.]|nr:hypothetical protein [Geobacter sp.]
MQIVRKILPLLLLVASAAPSFAAGNFAVAWKLDQVSAGEGISRNKLHLNVANLGSAVAGNAVAWTNGASVPALANRRFDLGTVTGGGHAAIVVDVILPETLASPGGGTPMIPWSIEFTNAAGERETVVVQGGRIPSGPESLKGGAL